MYTARLILIRPVTRTETSLDIRLTPTPGAENLVRTGVPPRASATGGVSIFLAVGTHPNDAYGHTAVTESPTRPRNGKHRAGRPIPKMHRDLD